MPRATRMTLVVEEASNNWKCFVSSIFFSPSDKKRLKATMALGILSVCFKLISLMILKTPEAHPCRFLNSGNFFLQTQNQVF